MTGGEAIAGIVVRVSTMGQYILSHWVDVTNVADGGDSQLHFTVLPAGIAFARCAAMVAQAYAALAAGLAEIPGLATSFVSLLVVLIS